MKGWNENFQHWQVSRLAISSVAAYFDSPNIQSVDLASYQLLRASRALAIWFLDYLHSASNLYSILCLPFHPLTTNQCNVMGTFYKKQKLSNTVKWFISCVSFICLLIILGWFKINYLLTSNVHFGTVPQNPVTYAYTSQKCTKCVALYSLCYIHTS